MTTRRFKTQYFPKFLDQKVADNLFEFLKDTIEWEQGILSKQGPTRLAKSISNEELIRDFPEILNIISDGLEKLDQNFSILGCYLNFYEDGKMYTPNHSHSGTQQMIISLGVSRTFTIGKKEILLGNGDMIVFGSAVHGIPKDLECTQGRISIAVFLVRRD